MNSKRSCFPDQDELASDREGGKAAGEERETASRRSLAFPLAIANLTLDPSSPLPIHEQICQGVRKAVWARELPSGTLLPASRELARHLGVARNTVVFAYARLVAEGLCVSNTRRGTRIASGISPRTGGTDSLSAEGAPAGPALLHAGFNARNALETRVDRVIGGAPFALHASDPLLYPRTKLGRRLADKFLLAPFPGRISPGASNEVGHFQTSVAAFLRQARGVVCAPSQVLAVSSLESALSLTARVLVDPGDNVVVEEPAMDVVHSAFLSARAQLRPMPGDAQGSDPKRVKGPPARLVFVSPSVSFPFGLQMPETRRLEILEAAKAQNAIVFENDVYGELRYSGARLCSMQGLDTDRRVIHYGGFFETLGKSVNVGYLVVPQSLLDYFVEVGRRVLNAPAPQVLDALAEFIDEHEYSVHVRNVRGVYARRLELVKQACKMHMPAVEISEPDGGLHIVLRPEDPFDEIAICEAGMAEGLPLRPLSRYHLQKAAARGFVFGFGAVPERAIHSMIKRLSEILGTADHSKIQRMFA